MTRRNVVLTNRERSLRCRRTAPGQHGLHGILRAHRRAYSLIEVLAALLLASILMVSVLQLLKNLHAQEKLVDRTAALHAPWLDRIFRMLERDFRNARQINVTQSGVQLSGFSSTDIDSGAPELSSGIVAYRTVFQDERWMLIREQQPEVIHSNRPPVRQTIAVGISEISFWYQEATGVRYPPTTESAWVPTPRGIGVQLLVHSDPATLTSENQRAIYRSILVRADGRWFQ